MAQRRFKVAFSVDEEVRRDHDLVAFGDAFADRHEAFPSRANLDLAWLEPPLALVEDDDLSRAAVDDGALWNGEHRRATSGRDLDVRVHGWPQHAVPG